MAGRSCPQAGVWREALTRPTGTKQDGWICRFRRSREQACRRACSEAARYLRPRHHLRCSCLHYRADDFRHRYHRYYYRHYSFLEVVTSFLP